MHLPFKASGAVYFHTRTVVNQKKLQSYDDTGLLRKDGMDVDEVKISGRRGAFGLLSVEYRDSARVCGYRWKLTSNRPFVNCCDGRQRSLYGIDATSINKSAPHV